MRITKKNRQQILNDNEGFVTHTSFSSRNFSEHRTYSISGGKLHIREEGNTSWADSRYDDVHTFGADDEETKQFLRNNKGKLKLRDT